MTGGRVDPGRAEPGPVPAGPRCELCGEPVRLDDGSVLALRHTTPADADAVRALYRRLSRTDLHRRFFSGALPPPSFFDSWTDLEERGGFGLVAEVAFDGRRRIVGEAGYAPVDDAAWRPEDPPGSVPARHRDDGRTGAGADGSDEGAGPDGELGIVVDPDRRGWLGPWLLASLIDHARARGVPNIQAVVLASNRTMLALARRRGLAVLGHPDPGVIRVTMSTSGPVPSWPEPHRRPRVLVESAGTRWRGEERLDRAGYDVALCDGSCHEPDRCPVLGGRPCPLVAGADAVVVELDPTDATARDLLAGERVLHPGIRLVAGRVAAADGGVVERPLDEIRDELGRLLDPEPASGVDPDPGGR